MDEKFEKMFEESCDNRKKMIVQRFELDKNRRSYSLKELELKELGTSSGLPDYDRKLDDILIDEMTNVVLSPSSIIPIELLGIDKNKKRYDKKIPMKEFNNIKEENKMGSLVEVKEKMIEDAEFMWVDGYMTINLEWFKSVEFASGKIFVFANRSMADYGSQFYRDPKHMEYEHIPFKSLFGYCDQLMIMKVKALVSREEAAIRSAFNAYPTLEDAPKEFEIEEIIPTERIPKFIESQVIFGNDNEKFKFFEIGENDIREGLTYRFTKMINGLFKFKSEESSRLFVKNILLNDSSTTEYIKCLEDKIDSDDKLTPGSIDIMHCIDANLEKMYFVISMLHSEQFDTKEMISFMKDYKIN